MFDLIKLLFSFEGILLLIVGLYVIDDVCGLGWKKMAREQIGRDKVFHDPEIDGLRARIETLETHANNSQIHVRATGARNPAEMPSPPGQSAGAQPTVPQPPNDAVNKGWKSWADQAQADG